jgi:hypothetical protein
MEENIDIDLGSLLYYVVEDFDEVPTADEVLIDCSYDSVSL